MGFKKLIFLFFSIWVSTAHAAEISGRVLFRKDGKSFPSSHSIMRLHVYRDDYEYSGAEIITDAQGKYAFHDLGSGERYAYILYPVYDGINYPYQEITFEHDKDSVRKDFTISPSTGLNKDISVNESIYFEIGQKDIWKVTHEISLVNDGDTMYHPDRPDAQPLQFSLYKGGFDIAYLDGISRDTSKIDEENDILQVFLTLEPHQTTKIKFSYFYLPDKRHISFERPSYLKRNYVNLFFHNNVRVFSEQFKFDPMLSKTDKQYPYAYSSGTIDQSKFIRYDIRGFYLRKDLLHLVVLLACATLLIIAIFFMIRYGREANRNTNELTDQMYHYLVSLKKQRQDSLITEAQYRRERYKVLNFLFQQSKKS